MEIKKGISQMAEYPNVEINYVMPADGRMYYVLKDGILANGCIIATLDPKYAIDEEKNLSTSVGVFSESGEILISFNKKSIKSISEHLVLVENAKLTTQEVIGVLEKENDPMISQSVADAKENILMRLKSQMSPTGEILFSNPYSEANIYRLDSYEHKLGIDCSFIGRNETGLFFHTNDLGSQIQIIEVDDFKKDDGVVVENLEGEMEPQNLQLDINSDILNGFNIPDEDLEKVKDQDEDSSRKDEVVSDSLNTESSTLEDEIESTKVAEVNENQGSDTDSDIKTSTIEEDEDDSQKEEISLNIMDEDNSNEGEEDSSKKEEKGMEKEKYKNRTNRKKQREIDLDIDEDDEISEEEDIDENYNRKGNKRRKGERIRTSDQEEVLDHAIEVINRMIKETNKLKRRIALLEEQLQEKDEIIQESESKKDELNEILDKANEVLQKIS